MGVSITHPPVLRSFGETKRSRYLRLFARLQVLNGIFAGLLGGAPRDVPPLRGTEPTRSWRDPIPTVSQAFSEGSSTDVDVYSSAEWEGR